MNKDEVFQAMLNLVTPMERDAMSSPSTKPVWQAAAGGLAALSERHQRRRQASSYIAPHSLQTHPPAGFATTTKLSLTLERTGNTDLALYVAARRMVVLGPSERTYVNVDPIEFARRDELTTRDAIFECATPAGDALPGECGNLDFLVNDDLNTPKGLPEGWFLADVLSLADSSRGRAKGGASIITMGGQTAFKDSGIPSTFESADTNLYAEVLFSANADNIGKLYRIQYFRWPNIEEPAGSNIRPNIVVLDDINVRERWKSVLTDDGGVFTDRTDAANSEAVGGDVPLLPAVPVVNDAVYFGAAFPINRIGLRLDTVSVGVYTIVWEIWDGFVWAAAPGAQDGTLGFTKPGLGYVTVENLTTQVPTTINGTLAFWVRARVSAFTSITTGPVAGYGFPLCWEPLATEDTSLEWAVRDFKDLGFTITAAKHVSLGRDDDLGVIGDGRGLYPSSGDSQEAFRSRVFKIPDVVSPNALERVLNRILAPLRYTGRIVDIGDDVAGFFFDVDALDYYQGGDLYPQNKWHLLLSTWEAYGFFYAQVPWIGEGDFGIFFDDGPVYYMTQKSLYVGPSYDEGFFDGFSPFAAKSVYTLIYDELRRRKGGGVAFALLPDESLNTP